MRCVAIVLVVISGYLLLDLPHVYHAKTSSFLQLSRQKTSQLTLKKHKTHEQHGMRGTFAKMLPKNKDKKHWKTKTPKRRAVDDNLTKHRAFVLSTKKPPKHKRHTPRGGRRTCYLLLVVVVVLIVLLVLRSASATAIASI